MPYLWYLSSLGSYLSITALRIQLVWIKTGRNNYFVCLFTLGGGWVLLSWSSSLTTQCLHSASKFYIVAWMFVYCSCREKSFTQNREKEQITANKRKVSSEPPLSPTLCLSFITFCGPCKQYNDGRSLYQHLCCSNSSAFILSVLHLTREHFIKIKQLKQLFMEKSRPPI